MADTVYVVDGYVDTGYFVYTANAGATLTSAAFLPPDTYFAPDYITADYVVTPVLLADRIRGTTPTLTATTAISAQADNIVKATATLSGITATLTVAGRLSPSDVDVQVTSTLTAAAGAIRDPGLSTRIVRWDQLGRWDPWFGTYWDPSGVTGQELPAYTAVAVLAEVRQTGTATITGTATVSVTAQSFSDRSAQLSVTAQAETTPDRIRNTAATATVTSTLSVSATTVIEGQAEISSAVTATAQAERIRTATSNLSVAVTVSALPDRVRAVTQELQAFNTQLTAAARTRGFGAALVASASVDTTAVKTAQGVIAASTQAQLEAQALQIAANRANLFSTFEQTAHPTRIRPTGQATFATQATFSINAGLQASAQAQLLAMDFVLATGRRVPFRAEHELRVPAETRIWPVLEQLRTLAVSQETRLNMVLPESRQLSVPEETRVYQVI